MAAQKTTDAVWDLAEPIAEELGLTLWDVQFIKEGASWYLRVFIDKDGGINIDDCTNMSHAIDPVLDETDFIDRAYYLEVSSPGLGRKLTRPEHFEQLNGDTVTVHLVRPKDGKRDFTGELVSFDGNIVTIKENDINLEFDKKEYSFVKLCDDIF